LNRYDDKRIAALYRDLGQQDSINRLVVSPNFLEMMGIPMLLGRGFNERDHETAPKVVVINDAAARKYFPDANPVGQRFGSSVETSGQLEIVGVLRDAKYDSVREPAPPTMYVPHLQARTTSPMFTVRTAGDPMSAIGAIREAVKQVDPTVPIMNVATQMEQVEQRLVQERLFAQAYALFGALALVLASVGLFGLMSYNVSRRTNEIGIRMALGAERGHVLGQVMRESMILVAAGVGIGLAIAVGLSRFIASLLFGVAAKDPGTIVLAITVMGLVAAMAAYLPARRASQVDPMVALRYE
jgi:predicted permease